MRRIILATTVIVALSFGLADVSQANVCAKAYSVRHAVVKKFGKRSAGLNICRDGIKGKKGWRQAHYKEKKRYLFALRRLNTPYGTLVAGSPRVPPAGTSTARAGGYLRSIAACESGGNYATNTGNGFYGAYQFDLQTWQSVGGSGLPSNASPAEQDRRAAILHSQRGSSPWPVCG